MLPEAVFCIPVRFCPSSPQPPSPTRGEGGVWSSRCLKREMARRGFPENLPLWASPNPLLPQGLGADRTFEQRCVFWRCNGQSALTPDPSTALRERGESEASLPRYDAVRGLYRTYFLSALESHKGRKGRLSVLKPKTKEETQGLPKNLLPQETTASTVGTGRRSAGVRLEKQPLRLLTVFASRQQYSKDCCQTY